VGQPYSSAVQQPTSETTTSTRGGTQAVSQAMMVPVSPAQPSNLPRRSTPSTRRVRRH
jgi:hypothetical protein